MYAKNFKKKIVCREGEGGGGEVKVFLRPEGGEGFLWVKMSRFHQEKKLESITRSYTHTHLG